MQIKNKTSKNTQKTADLNLYEATCNASYELISVPGIALLRSMGIINKLTVYKKYRYAFGGPVILMIDHSQVAVGKEIASQIQVKEVS